MYYVLLFKLTYTFFLPPSDSMTTLGHAEVICDVQKLSLHERERGHRYDCGHGSAKGAIGSKLGACVLKVFPLRLFTGLDSNLK